MKKSLTQTKPESRLSRRRKLALEREKIATLAPEQALSAILDAAQPAALVNSYPEQDLHLLVREIGPEESLPLLGLASNRQWEYILDVEIWEKDRLDIPRMTRWLERLLRADASACRLSWLMKEKIDLVISYLFRTVEIVARNPDEEPSDFGEDFSTLDGVFYFRERRRDRWASAETPDDEEKEPFPLELLRRIAGYDHETYQRTLLETPGVIASELEEDAYRWRNVRLAEKAIPPFEEAVGVYRPVSPEAIARFSRPSPPGGRFPMVPGKAAGYMPGTGLFESALTRIDHRIEGERIQFEFAALANRIIVADRQRVREPEDLKAAVRKACGYINIGLERLMAPSGKTGPDHASGFLLRHPLMGIFQVGWAEAVQLGQRAIGWIKSSWFTREGFPLSFWGERWMGVLGGLLLKRPRYYDGLRGGSFYREFESPADISDAVRTLERITAMDHLLSRIPMSVGTLRTPVPVSYKNLLLTLWVRDFLGLPDVLEAVAVDKFREFFKILFDPGRNPPAGASRTRNATEPLRSAFGSWVSRTSDLPSQILSGVLSAEFDAIFNEIQDQYGLVSPEALDPRYVELFLLEAAPDEPRPGGK